MGSHSPTIPTPTTTPRQSAESRISPAAAAAIGGGILAAALLSAVATRRVPQQRRRHRGRRIALPADGAAATEENSRTDEAALDCTTLDGALRTAAVHLSTVQRLSNALTLPTALGTVVLLTVAAARHEQGSLLRAVAVAAAAGALFTLFALGGM
ncbi:hypothetical protein [Streptomyces albospinus]|nr:hypothetical protein [Streptomyces albospinus]